MKKKPKPTVGRPPKQGSRRVQLVLSAQHVETAKKLGNGNLTRGVETALDKAK